jgi:hypothetical protein
MDKLRKHLAYDPETGVFTRIASRRTDLVGSQAGTVGKNGYVYINVGGKLYLGHRVAWFFVHGVEPEGHIDHINRDRADNRLANLRDCPTKQRGNGQNTRVRPNNTSGFTGVHWFKRISKWQVYINIDGKRKSLGYYADLEDAKAAYAKAKAKYHTFHNEVVYG